MFSPRLLGPGVWAAPQLSPDDLAQAFASGVRQIVNNRPDGEDHGQPSSLEMQCAAQEAGLTYVHAPVTGFPDAPAVDAVIQAIESGEPVLLYCRSGMRSAVTWALAMRRLDRASADDLREAAAEAGYDLSRVPL